MSTYGIPVKLSMETYHLKRKHLCVDSEAAYRSANDANVNLHGSLILTIASHLQWVEVMGKL